LVPQTFPVTARVVDTYGKVEFDGGYLQISMEEPSGDGSWPGLWLLPGAGARNVGNNFEIHIQGGGYTDGSANPNDVFAYHLHTPDGTFGGEVNTGIDLTAGYNTYAIDWVPGESITWYLNGTCGGRDHQRGGADTGRADGVHHEQSGRDIRRNRIAYDDRQLHSSVPVAPTVAITSVGSPTTSAVQTIKGTVDVADVGSTVELLDGSTQIGPAVAASNGAWSANVTLANQGANVLTASDANAAGTGKSNAVTFVLHSVAPTVAITSVGSTTTSAVQTIKGTVDVADAGSTVELLDGSTHRPRRRRVERRLERQRHTGQSGRERADIGAFERPLAALVLGYQARTMVAGTIHPIHGRPSSRQPLARRSYRAYWGWLSPNRGKRFNG
jgi:beta-glucanase (GH16 family)